ncbi:MAG: hypothetical protein Q9202_002047 [Teloschistes flavicans]
MPSLLDAVVHDQIWTLEHAPLTNLPFQPFSDGSPSVASAARSFYGLKESTSKRSRGYSDRAKELLETLQGLYPQVDFRGLVDFQSRQDKAALEYEIAEANERLEKMEIQGPEDEEEMETEDGNIVEARDGAGTDSTTSTTSSSTANPHFIRLFPFSLPVRSITTATRFLVAKPDAPPFTLRFNGYTETYGLQEFECKPADRNISNPTARLLYYLDPDRLGYVAYSRYSLYVHTRGVHSFVQRKATVDSGAEVEGGFVNVGCENREDVEELVRHFEERKKEGVVVESVDM